MGKIEEVPFQIKAGNPLSPGVSVTEAGCNFTVTARQEQRVELLLYPLRNSEVEMVIPLAYQERFGQVRSVLVEGLPGGRYEYNYCIDGQVMCDPYARSLTGRSQFAKGLQELEAGRAEPGAKRNARSNVHHVRGRIENAPEEVSLGSWIPYEDTILYKLHVRGFTMHRSSRVKNKGTFAGLKEKIPYLKDLGITTIELMPAYDFEECSVAADMECLEMDYGFSKGNCNRINYWGYTGGYYFAPKASYCAGEDPVAEYRETVRAIHQAGMELLMEFYFPEGTGAAFVLEVLRFWKLWYGVDGFHLTGCGISMKMIGGDPILSGSKILYEDVDTEESTGHLPQKRLLAQCHRGFLENARRFLKGDEDQVSGLMWQLRNNANSCGVVNYIVSQDGFTLSDLVSYDYRHNEENGEENRDGSAYNYSWNCGVEGPTRKVSVMELRMRQMKNAMLLLLLSQGTPMLYAGDEWCNSQNGNNNAYCQDNPIGWVNWTKNKKSEAMYAFVKAAIHFRRSHKVFHQDHLLRDTDYRSLGIPEVSFHGQRAWVADMESTSRQLGVMYCGAYSTNQDQQPDDYFYVAYNMHWEAQEFALPKLPVSLYWNLAIDSGAKGETGIYQEEQPVPEQKGNHFRVPPRTIIVLIGRGVKQP